MPLHVTPPTQGLDEAADPGTGTDSDPFHSTAAIRAAAGGEDVLPKTGFTTDSPIRTWTHYPVKAA
jgi:hypothetical protein